MRIAFGLHVDPAEGGGARIRARDWPWAGLVAAALLLPGVSLVAWAAAGGHWIEAGGAGVFTGFGLLAAWLAAARRRDVVLREGSLRGREGAGPLARATSLAWTGAARLDVRPFAAPAGAPDLADRGGDLVLVAGGAEVLLARRAGAGWRAVLDAARARVAEGARGIE